MPLETQAVEVTKATLALVKLAEVSLRTDEGQVSRREVRRIGKNDAPFRALSAHGSRKLAR